MKLNINNIALIIIFLLAAFLRLHNLSSVPPQATVDEVSIGYNAYSILKTGSDEFGSKFPVLLRAYDDWRPALYVYLVIPFISILGLETLSVRLPSVILSILSVIAVYFLIRELTKGANKISVKGLIFDIPLVSAFLFAISPWHIYLSRLGHEVNASFSFMIFGTLFFYKYLSGKKIAIYLSAFFFALSFFSYQSGKIITPFLVISLLVLYYKEIWKNKIHIVASGILGIILISPILISSFDENALIRFKGTSLIGNSPAYFEDVAQRYFIDKINGDEGFIFDNKKVASVLLITNAGLSHLSPSWLFYNGGNESFKSPTFGLLYLFEFPLIFLSLVFLLNSGINKRSLFFLGAWGIVAVIPGSITNGYPHAMRVMGALPLPQIMAGIGFIGLLSIMKNKKYSYPFLSFSFMLAIISIIWFYHSYFHLLPRELSQQFQFGVINALNEVKKIDGNYKQIYVSNRESLFESYMFYLFNSKYDPKAYHELGGTISGGYDYEHKIGKYTFGNLSNKIKRKGLYVMNPSEYQDLKRYYNLADGKAVPRIEFNVLSKIYYMNGRTAFLIVETK